MIMPNDVKKPNPLLRLCFAVVFGVFTIFSGTAIAGSLEQAKRIHDRIAGVPPSETRLVTMRNAINEDGDGVRAAMMAMGDDAFYNVTLKNWAAPWTNREFNVFVPLNDYIATIVGIVRDNEDFRTALYADVIYVGDPGLGLAAYSNSNNNHYEALESGGYSLQDNLVRITQSSVTGLPDTATAGVVTSRAAAKSFFIAGTNRANFRYTLINHLCVDLEQVHDITRVPDRIRQDVSRSPGGDARVFLNTCVGCHNGMDPMAQAFAYYDYIYDAENDLTGENGAIEYNTADDPETGSRVQPKYRINSATFPYGYVTPDDKWDNYWREGVNTLLGWDESLPGTGSGARSMLQELAYSDAFAQCQVKKVFKAVCLRDPQDSADRAKVTSMVSSFTGDSYNLKTVFAQSADYCKGP